MPTQLGGQGQKRKPHNTKTKCPEGTLDAGWMGCKKQSYGVKPTPAKCKGDLTYSAGVCLKQCPAGFTRFLSLCAMNCPAEMSKTCGLMCLAPGESCGSVMSQKIQQIQKVISSMQGKDVQGGLINVG